MTFIDSVQPPLSEIPGSAPGLYSAETWHEKNYTETWHESRLSGANAALFLQLDLLSTVIQKENRAFRKTVFKPKEFENAGFAFLYGTKTS